MTLLPLAMLTDFNLTLVDSFSDSKLIILPFLLISVSIALVMFALNSSVYEAYAQQGGAAEGGDATVGGPICNVAYACTITQAPIGGAAS